MEWSPGQMTTGELSRKRAELEHQLEQKLDNERWQAATDRLRRVIAEQDQRRERLSIALRAPYSEAFRKFNADDSLLPTAPPSHLQPSTDVTETGRPGQCSPCAGRRDGRRRSRLPAHGEPTPLQEVAMPPMLEKCSCVKNGEPYPKCVICHGSGVVAA